MQFYSQKTEKLAFLSNVGILIGVLLPWVSVPFIVSVSISGFSLVFGKVLAGLSIANLFVSANLKRRIRPILDIVIALIDLCIFYNAYSDLKSQLYSGIIIQSLPWQFGLYLTIISVLVLLVTGIIRIAGDSTWWSFLFSQKISSLQSEINHNEVAATADISSVPKVTISRTKLGRGALGVVALLAIYFVSMMIYNNANGPHESVKKFMAAVKGNDVNSVRALTIDKENQPLTLNAAQVYIDYYTKHLDELQNNIGSLDSNYATFGGIGTTLTKHSIMGYTSYKIQLPTTHFMVDSLKGSQISINQSKQSVPATGNPQDIGVFVSNVPLNVTVTDKTAWGDVTETKQALPGTETSKFQFSNYKISVNPNGLLPGSEFLIDAKDSGQKVSKDNNSLGPLPQGKNYAISVNNKEPFGDIAFAASAQTGNTDYMGVKLTADQKENKAVLESIANFLYKFTNIAGKGGVSTYLVPDSPATNSFQNDRGALITAQSLTVYPKTLALVQVGNEVGVQIQDSVTGIEHEAYGDSNGTWSAVYTLTWDSSAKTWKLYNIQMQLFWFGSDGISGKNDVTVTQ